MSRQDSYFLWMIFTLIFKQVEIALYVYLLLERNLLDSVYSMFQYFVKMFGSLTIFVVKILRGAKR